MAIKSGVAKALSGFSSTAISRNTSLRLTTPDFSPRLLAPAALVLDATQLDLDGAAARGVEGDAMAPLQGQGCVLAWP